MSLEMIVFIVFILLGVLFVGFLVHIKIPKRLNQKKYIAKWRELQGHCKDKTCWKDAIILADKLLDSALKQRKFKGKTPGERLVSAQRKFTNNDGVWYAHNLFKKLNTNVDLQPKEEDTKRALNNFRQALRDLGALPSGEQNK